MKFLSLFAGIGGFDLGLERAGMTCVGQVEIDPFCRAVLAKHWPGVKRMEDVRSVKGDEFGPVDLVCGGVPCQPASCAGKRKGADDDRWLWPEFSRIVRAVRPTWFVAENVRGFLSLSAATGVIRDLEGAGYEIRTVLLGAHHVGAPHKRDRIWIVGRMADAASGGLGADGRAPWDAGHADECGAGVADAHRGGSGQNWWAGELRPEGTEQPPSDSRRANATEGGEVSIRWPARPGEPQHEWEAPRLAYTRSTRANPRPEELRPRDSSTCESGGWEPEPSVGVATHGIPRRLAGFARRSSLKALGNAVVPQVAEVIGRAIMEA